MRAVRRALLALIGWIVCSSAIQPAIGLEVDQCTSDVAPGGTNFATALAAGGKITFRCGTASIRITKSHSIDRSVEIDGGGQITLDGNDQSPLLDAAAAGVVIRLSNLTLRRFKSGPAEGAVQADQLFVDNCSVNDSLSPLRARTLINVARSEFNENRGTVVEAPFVQMSASKVRKTKGIPIFSFDGGVSIVDSEFSAGGRSVFQSGVGKNCIVAIARTSFVSNTTELSGDVLRPGAALTSGCSTEIKNSTFVGNKSTTDGGAIHIESTAPSLLIQGSRFEGNAARHHGGAIFVTAAKTTPQILMLKFSSFKSNAAETGGAIDFGEVQDSKSALLAFGVTFLGNTASAGGGAIAGTDGVLFTFRTAFKKNAAKSGGAILHTVLQSRPDNPDVLANTLFVLNQSEDGAVAGNTMRLLNTSVLGTSGPGLTILPVTADGDPARAIHLANSIVENNSGGNCKGKAGSFVDQGSNLQFPGATCGDKILVAVSVLDTFYAPIVGGPARARGDNAVCTSIAVQGQDLYGEKRPKSDRCSIGAVEGDLDRVINEHLLTKAALPSGKNCTPGVTGNAVDCEDDHPKPTCPSGSSGIYPACLGNSSKDDCAKDGYDKSPHCHAKNKSRRPHYPGIGSGCRRGTIGIPPYCFSISEIPEIIDRLEKQPFPRY